MSECYLKAPQIVTVEVIHAEAVEQQLDIAQRVDVAVEVDVGIDKPVFRYLGTLERAMAALTGYGTRTVAHQPVGYVEVFQTGVGVLSKSITIHTERA